MSDSATEETVKRVYCSQWAQCGWAGYRKVKKIGPQPEPCPKCGGTVTA